MNSTIPTNGINGIAAAPVDEQGRCLCHDALACPDDATVTIKAGKLAEIADVLDTLDAFLRSGDEVTGLLVEHLAAAQAPGAGERDIDPDYLRQLTRVQVNFLIDRVGLLAAQAHRLHPRGQHDPHPCQQRARGERR